MKPKILIIGATGRVGSQVVKHLASHRENVDIRLASQNPEVVRRWKEADQDAVLFNLNDSGTFGAALNGISRVFLLTPYSSDMLHQSKQLVDAAQQSGVSHIVHLGVFTSRRDKIPHFVWHDLVESYIESSGIAWTHLHPNVIAESILVTDPPITESGAFTVFWGDAPQGWVFAEDIAEVAATVLSEGPEKHASKEYWLSTEVLTGPQVAKILSDSSGRDIKCNVLTPDVLAANIDNIPSGASRAYMESAVITMRLAASREMSFQTVVRDDVVKVLGRPGTSMADWAKRNLRLLEA